MYLGYNLLFLCIIFVFSPCKASLPEDDSASSLLSRCKNQLEVELEKHDLVRQHRYKELNANPDIQKFYSENKDPNGQHISILVGIVSDLGDWGHAKDIALWAKSAYPEHSINIFVSKEDTENKQDYFDAQKKALEGRVSVHYVDASSILQNPYLKIFLNTDIFIEASTSKFFSSKFAPIFYRAANNKGEENDLVKAQCFLWWALGNGQGRFLRIYEHAGASDANYSLIFRTDENTIPFTLSQIHPIEKLLFPLQDVHALGIGFKKALRDYRFGYLVRDEPQPYTEEDKNEFLRKIQHESFRQLFNETALSGQSPFVIPTYFKNPNYLKIYLHSLLASDLSKEAQALIFTTSLSINKDSLLDTNSLQQKGIKSVSLIRVNKNTMNNSSAFEKEVIHLNNQGKQIFLVSEIFFDDQDFDYVLKGSKCCGVSGDKTFEASISNDSLPLIEVGLGRNYNYLSIIEYLKAKPEYKHLPTYLEEINKVGSNLDTLAGQQFKNIYTGLSARLNNELYKEWIAFSAEIRTHENAYHSLKNTVAEKINRVKRGTANVNQ